MRAQPPSSSTGEAASGQNPVYNSGFNYGCQTYPQSGRGAIVVYVRIREEDNVWCGGDDIILDGYFTINYSPFTHGEVPGEVNFGNGF